jgi:hypothetical protein
MEVLMSAKRLIGFVMAIAVCGACGDDDSRATTHSTTNGGTNNGGTNNGGTNNGNSLQCG